MKDRTISRANTRAVRVKRDEENKPAMITGYGAVYYRADDPGTEYVLWGDGREEGSAVERIMPGAFDEMPDDVRSMFNHDPNQVLGRTKSKTMRVIPDEIGVRYEVDINPDDPDHVRVVQKIERGDVDGSSFWFSFSGVTESQRIDNGVTVFEMEKITSTREMGPVTMPAYEATTTATRQKHIEERTQQHLELQKRLFDEHRERYLWLLDKGNPTAI